MRILHAPGWYPPASIGGTEVYVASLIAGLKRHGVRSTVVIPRPPGMPEAYEHDGVQVLTYPVTDNPTVANLRGAPQPDEIEAFRKVLGQGFDLYHQHTLTRGCGLPHLEAARAAGLRTVFTAHIANIVCPRNTLMRWGTSACDGDLKAQPCAACWSHDRGASRQVAEVANRVPGGMAALAEAWSRHGPRTPLSRGLSLVGAKALVAQRREEVSRLNRAADCVVAVSAWLYRALALNGVETSRLMLSPQGLDPVVALALQGVPPPGGKPVTLGFIGRWDPIKGLDLILRAFRDLPRDLDVRLEIHAAANGDEARAFRDACLADIADDPRVTVFSAYTQAGLPEILARLDAVLVPSQCQETGPLVVLEALAAGRWVLGSDLGGIPERIISGETGQLIAHDDRAAWTRAMAAFAAAPRRPATGPVRSMDDIADEMADTYRRLALPARTVAGAEA